MLRQLIILVGLLSMTSAIAEETKESVVVEIDIFSGVPNPKFELSERELLDLSNMFVSYCDKTDTTKSAYPKHHLSYRGILIHRVGKGTISLALRLGGGSAQFMKGSSIVCQEKLRAAASDLVALDTKNVELEIVNLAYRKGVIAKNIYEMIMSDMKANSAPKE
jgi:hypothetical protein